MAVLNFDHTLATAIKIKNDLNKLRYIITLFTQIVFIGFYTYLIITNVNHLVYLIIYSVLCGQALLFLLYYVIRLKGMSDRVKKIESRVVRRLFRMTKFIVKIFSLVLAIIQIVTMDTSQTMILITAFSAFFLILNIISEFVILYIDGAIDRIMIAYSMDRDQNILNKLISGDLNRSNFVVADEEELREKIRADKEKYIKPAPETNEPDPWWLRKVKKTLDRQVRRKTSNNDQEIIDVDVKKK